MAREDGDDDGDEEKQFAALPHASWREILQSCLSFDQIFKTFCKDCQNEGADVNWEECRGTGLCFLQCRIPQLGHSLSPSLESKRK
jgi:hypothetical protein